MSDPYFDNVTLLLHCDGSDGSTTFADVKGHTVTPAGNAQIDTAQSKWGGASALFDGSGDYLSIADSADWDLPGDWTAECWMRAASPINANRDIFSLTGTSWILTLLNNGYLGITTPNGGAYTAAPINAGTWYHVAWVMVGGQSKVYLNGALAITQSYTASITSAGPVIGYSTGSGRYFSGHLDDLRITKGVARYTTNFTPPTAAFADTDGYDNNVVFLCHANGTDASTTFTDEVGHTVTASGTGQVDTAQSKFGGASFYSDSNTAGGELQVTSDSSLNMADTNYWTAEAWVRWDTLKAADNQVCQSANSWILAYNPTYSPGRFGLYLWNGSAYDTTLYWTPTIAEDTWYHIAVVRDANVWRLFINGVQQGSGITYAFSMASPGTGLFRVGRSNSTNGWLDDIRITKGVARYTTNFAVPSTEFLYNPATTTTYTITINAGAYLTKNYNATLNAGAYLAYPATPGAYALGGGAALQRRFTPTASLNAAIQKQGLTKSPLIGSVLQKRLTKTASADSAIGRVMTLWAVAGSAELGVQQFLSLAAGYMLAGREYIPSDAVVQATLAKYASANSYVSLVGLTRSLTIDALFSSFKRAYAGAAVQGTATRTSSAGSAVQGTLGKTLTAGFYITGIPSALIVVANAYLAQTSRTTSGSNAWLAKTRAKFPRASAVLGVLLSKSLDAGAVLAKATLRTLSADTAVLATRAATAVPSAAVQSSEVKSLSVGAYLRTAPAHTVGAATLIDGEWVFLGRPLEWSPDVRNTEFVPDARTTEWVL